ncbi:MAG TPA: NAD(P)-dependent oxidoreductase [Steroidobacteraceae bacterium]|jgi:3-hydroxyisobutyrate dehydrogenase|nr:NAD(P)-dependent oxidoreductase [Steroidobacteraceae bacterium]
MQVGFVGIGNMGWPMAANLLKAGHSVTVYDSDAARAGRFVAEQGGNAASSLTALSVADFIVTMLPTGQIVRELYMQAQGQGLAASLRPGTVAIDMSSSEPTGTRELGALLAEKGIALVDAPVSGAVPRATTGTLTIMIGGDDAAAIERAKPLLSCMGNRLFDTGALGTGHAMKALNNFVAASGYAAAVEALLTGKRFGLDPTRMLEIMNVSTGRNFNTEVVLQEHVVGGKYASGFALGLLAKDVKIAADLTRAVNIDAPMAQLISRRYEQARDELGYARDNTEAILAWDKDSER